MWSLLGTWFFIVFVVGVVGLWWTWRARGVSRPAGVAVGLGFLALGGVLAAILIAPVQVADGTQCASALAATKAPPRNSPWEEELRANGAADHHLECRTAGRERYATALGGFLLIAGLGAAGLPKLVRGQRRAPVRVRA